MSTVDSSEKFSLRPGEIFGAFSPFPVDNPGGMLYDNRRYGIENHIVGCIV